MKEHGALFDARFLAPFIVRILREPPKPRYRRIRPGRGIGPCQGRQKVDIRGVPGSGASKKPPVSRVIIVGPARVLEARPADFPQHRMVIVTEAIAAQSQTGVTGLRAQA